MNTEITLIQKQAFNFCRYLNDEHTLSLLTEEELNLFIPKERYRENYDHQDKNLTHTKHVTRTIVERLVNELRQEPKPSYFITNEEYLNIKKLLNDEVLRDFIWKHLRCENMFPPDFVDWMFPIGDDCLIINIIRQQSMFYTHEYFCIGFNQWELVDPKGRTLAHYAAMQGKKIFNGTFDNWDLKDQDGRTVQDVLDMASNLVKYMEKYHGKFRIQFIELI